MASVSLAQVADDAQGTVENHELTEVVVGKDVLELVSSAMYVDPMTIYREYVQNAADAVDAARETGVLAADEAGRVEIFVDALSRTVRIRDNGCGLPFPDFGHKLTALGGSAKRGTLARGFRGVGRLAGLGYAQEVIFRSRVADEAKTSELHWDCRRLKAELRSASEHTGVADLIRSVTALRRVELNDAPTRFFEVELRGIVRQRNDRLMSPDAINNYLSQVAPVPFSPEFRFGAEITAALSRHLDPSTLDIRIEGVEEPVYRPHRDSFAIEDKADTTFSGLSLVEVPGVDGNIAALAWVLHHGYEGAVPAGTLVKGLRLRAGNIQVGNHALLEDLFPEPRFNAWSVGEVHVLDRRVVPNGRRDHFEQNTHFHNLLNHLTPSARDIARRCRTNSAQRKWLREFELHRSAAFEKLAIINQGSLSLAERDNTALSIEQTLLQMEKVASNNLPIDHDTMERQSQVMDLRAQLKHSMQENTSNSSPLARLTEEKRAMYEHMFGLIYSCSTNRNAAKSLIDRIMIRLE